MSPTSAILLYLVFALGGVALYLMLPGGEGRRTGAAGGVLGLVAVLALFLVLAARGLTGGDHSVYFYLFSSIALLAASRVVTHRKPVYSAIYFVLVVVATAAMLVLLQAEFLAVALIIIYAGAIIVTYLFVIMLAQQPSAPVYDTRSREPLLAVLVGFVLMAGIAGQAGDLAASTKGASNRVAALSPSASGEESAKDHQVLPPGNTAAVGAVLMTRYVVVLEIAGVLLLVSMIGAVALSRKRVPYDGPAVPATPLGQIGREVEPF